MGKIAIDFNGTIEDSNNVPKGKKFGPPLPGAEDTLEGLIQEGHEVIIFTEMAKTSSGRQAVADWLEYFDISYSEITALKPNASIFIDDKGLRFTSWASTIKELRGFGIELD